MQRMLIAGLALALAGCGGGEDVANNMTAPAPTPSPTPGPMLGGVDLNRPVHATGSAPRWAIYIAPGTIAFTEGSAAPVDFFPASPTLAGDTARLQTQTPKGEPVTITLVAKICGTGKAQLPLTAELKIGSRILKGCAGTGTYDWARPAAQPK